MTFTLNPCLSRLIACSQRAISYKYQPFCTNDLNQTLRPCKFSLANLSILELYAKFSAGKTWSMSKSIDSLAG